MKELLNQREFVREHQAEAVGIARRMWAAEKPYVVHYLSCRAQPASAKPDSMRFATLDEAEAFAQACVREWGTAAASVWEEVPRGIVLGEAAAWDEIGRPAEMTQAPRLRKVKG